MLKKIVLATAIVTAFATSAFAADPATHNYNKAVVANQRAAWTEMVKASDTVTPVIQNNKFYIHNDARITYYDEWVSHEKGIQQALDHLDVICNAGLPVEYLEELNKGGDDNEGNDGND